MRNNHTGPSQTEAAETEIRSKHRLTLQGKLGGAERLAKLHPASPALRSRIMVSEGRMRSLEERKAAPLWHRPKE